MPNFIINKTYLINGRKIVVKVTGEAGSENDNRPFLLLIPGGPGYGSELVINSTGKKIDEAFAEEKKAPMHIIYFDPLGCGESDKAEDPNKEYTIDNFTDIAANIVELVKEDLKCEKLNLYVQGNSFGGMVAMNLPIRQPEWTEDSSAIRINHLMVVSSPNKLNEQKEVLQYIESNYKDHPNFANIHHAASALMDGNIKDEADFIHTIVINLAPLYANANEKMLNGLYGALLRYNPDLFVTLAKVALYIDPNITRLKSALVRMTGCNIDVLNHFFKHADDFDAAEIINKNKKLFTRFPFLSVGGDSDYIANAETSSQTLQTHLPHDLAVVTFNAKHQFNADFPDVYKQLLKDVYVHGQINENYLYKHSLTNPINKLKCHKNPNQFSNYAISSYFVPLRYRYFLSQNNGNKRDETVNKDQKSQPIGFLHRLFNLFLPVDPAVEKEEKSQYLPSLKN